ncbi:MAG: NAD(P)H-dependent oxidoreductase [Verrucomicrobiota bacterium]
MKLLHLNSSILGAASVSRVLSREIVKAQRRLHHGIEVIYPDLVADPLHHFSGAHLSAGQAETPPTPGLDIEAGSKALDDFLSANIIVVGLPMYNHGVPSRFKAWIDRVSVAGRTFRYTEKGPEGLAGGKKVFVASPRGGAYAEPSAAFLDHQETYLRAVFGFLGIIDITFVRAGNLGRRDLRDKSIQAARAQISAMAE